MDLCEQVVDCPHSTPVWSDSGPVVLRSHNIRNGRLDLTSPSYTDEGHFADRTRRATPRAGDLVITREAPMGQVAMIPPDLRCCLGQRIVLLRPDPAKVDPRFLLFALQSPSVQHEISVHDGTGSTVSNLRIPLLEALPIPSPAMVDQRAIAHILGTLDDKIELNRRMNETLEAIARALFKSWFVDFDPVRAKSEGRAPGLPPHLADLFPDSFEDSELGEIPAGWVVGRFGDLADLNVRTLGSGDSLDVIDYVEISEVMRGQVGTVARYERGTEPSRARRRLVHGDTVLSTVRPDRGSYFLALAPPETLLVSTGFVVASPRDGNWAFLYSALTRPEVGDELGRLADGGAYPAVRPEVVSGFRLVNPPASEMRAAYDAITRPLYERFEHNEGVSRTLAALRDTLLPRLISGELRIADADAAQFQALGV